MARVPDPIDIELMPLRSELKSLLVEPTYDLNEDDDGEQCFLSINPTETITGHRLSAYMRTAMIHHVRPMKQAVSKNARILRLHAQIDQNWKTKFDKQVQRAFDKLDFIIRLIVVINIVLGIGLLYALSH